MVVDALEHQEADGPVGGANEQHRVYPRGVIRGQQCAAVDRNIFLALQIEAVNRVGRNPEQKAEQGIRQEPEEISKRAEGENRSPEENYGRAQLQIVLE